MYATMPVIHFNPAANFERNKADYECPLADGKEDKCFISRGYDAFTHFESTVDDILEMYTRITGKELDLDNLSLNQTIEG